MGSVLRAVLGLRSLFQKKNCNYNIKRVSFFEYPSIYLPRFRSPALPILPTMSQVSDGDFPLKIYPLHMMIDLTCMKMNLTNNQVFQGQHLAKVKIPLTKNQTQIQHHP